MARPKKTETPAEASEISFLHPAIIKVRLQFTEEVLGTSPNNKDLLGEYIASKAPDAELMADEIERVGVDAVKEKGMTVFPRDADGTPIIYDYQIRGFFKESIGFIRGFAGTACSKVKAYKKMVDGSIFVYPRNIRLDIPKMASMGECQRALRASTPMGERVTLACSETAPAGTRIEFTVKCYTDAALDCVYECLQYGADHGLLQWRNSGKGKFSWEEID